MKQYTNESQTAKLIELGFEVPKSIGKITYSEQYGCGYEAAYSIGELIEMMPNVITRDDYTLILGVNASCVYYADDEYAETFKAFEGNLYECVVKCIEWLIKEGYFNKEYLEE